MNAYFCAFITFCFPPKPLPLPLLLLPSSFIATGGLGFPVFLFEEARILFFFFCVTSSSLPSSFRLFAAFSSPFSRLYNNNREEQKKRRNLNEEQRTRDEFLFFSITQHSRQLIKRDDLIKTDDGTKAQRICFYHHPQSVRIKRVSKEQTRSLLLTLRLRRNGDFANADLFPYLLGVKSVDRGVGGNASRTRQQKAQNNTKNNAYNNNTTSRQFLSL